MDFEKFINRFKIKEQAHIEKNDFISQDMEEAVKLWLGMYLDKSPWKSNDVKSLNLASTISSEIAKQATIEMKSSIVSLDDEKSGISRGDYLDEIYQNIIGDIRICTEYCCALGGLIFKPYIQNGKIAVDYVKANSFYPTEFDSSGRIISAVFVDKKYVGKKIFTRLEIHSMTKEGVVIKNSAFVADKEKSLDFDNYTNENFGRQISLKDVPDWASLTPEVLIKGIKRPLFAFLKMPGANSIDINSPLGVSVFSRACDLIHEADEQYSRLIWEYTASEYAIYVDELAMKPIKDKQGKILKYSIPEKQKRIIKGLNFSGCEDLFKEWAPKIRDVSLINGLNELFMRIEDTCGLSRGTFSNAQSQARTATELRILRHRSYALISDIQKQIKLSLIELVEVLDIYATLYHLAPEGKTDVSFEFDDSTIIDRSDEFEEKQILVDKGLMKKWEFRMWYFGENEETAKKMIGED